MQKQKIIVPFAALVLAALLLFGCLSQLPSASPTPSGTPTPLPSASATPTPGASATPTPQNPNYVTMHQGESRDGLELSSISYPASVSGSIERMYPVAYGNPQPVTLHVGEKTSNGCNTFTLVQIAPDYAVFTETLPGQYGCPICLSQDTLIGTPSGGVKVTGLRQGMAVWTAGLDGKRETAVVLKTSRTQVPLGHQMVHLKLADGRELYASPGHPLPDGRVLAQLEVGEAFENSTVKTAELVAYGGEYTYDLLPSGPTGLYWANGILVGSTLK